MFEIVLTDEQARVVSSALKPVQVRDRKGNVLGTITPAWTEADVAEAKRILATNKTWYTTEQVLSHLRSLEKE
jgi:hypothetical protein